MGRPRKTKHQKIIELKKAGLDTKTIAKKVKSTPNAVHMAVHYEKKRLAKLNAPVGPVIAPAPVAVYPETLAGKVLRWFGFYK